MKLTCPACSAQYTIATERLEGRRVKVRCKRCGESFPIDSSKQRGELCARREPATPLTGERNESSVLFSLATLAKRPPASPPAKVTESSSLIDIRALVSASATSTGQTSTPRADDIMNLGGGGAVAPLFAAPVFAPPVTFVPAENEETARRGNTPIVIGAMALAVVAMVGIASLVGARSRSSAPRVAVVAPADVPSVADPAPSIATASLASEATPASSTQVAAVPPVRTSATSKVAPPSRSAARANDPRSVATQAAATSRTSPVAKCCPGESEMACHMRLAVGASCGAE